MILENNLLCVFNYLIQLGHAFCVCILWRYFKKRREQICYVFGALENLFKAISNLGISQNVLQTHEGTTERNSLFLDLRKSPLKVTSFNEIQHYFQLPLVLRYLVYF